MKGRGSIVVVLVAVCLTSGVAGARAPAPAVKAEVTHVSDGDTAYLKPLRYGTTAASWPGRKARFIGIDTPEIYSGPDCYGPEASAFTTRKLEGKTVKVTYGEEPVDHYDRALIYVWLKGHLFNRMLVRKGFAKVSTYPPNDRYEPTLLRAQRKAKEESRGLWGAC